MKVFRHIFLVILLFSCTGCVTGMVIQQATTRAPKRDNVEIVGVFQGDKDLILNLKGSLAEKDYACYSVKLDNQAAKTDSYDYRIARSKISKGFFTPTREFTEIKVVKAKTDNLHKECAQLCCFVQDCKSGQCKSNIDYVCYDDSASRYRVRHTFRLEPEETLPPLYKLGLVPLTLPVDIIALPFEIMIATGLSNFN